MAYDPNMDFTKFTNAAGEQNITVLIDGKLYPARNDNPNWDAIVAGAEAKDPDIVALFKPADAISKKFAELTERVSVHNGEVLWDGEPIHNSLTQKILALMDERVEDWRPFVEFMDKLYTNPNEHSRKQAFDYLVQHHHTITANGNFLAYKGVDVDGGSYYSRSRGIAIVNDEEIKGNIPNAPGSVIRMPRADVLHDPYTPCHIGLHVATFDFAKRFIYGGTVLEVEVNPRDIVSVDQPSAKTCSRVSLFASSRVPKHPAMGSARGRSPNMIKYAIVRYVDDLTRNEPVNVGVIVYDGERVLARFDGEDPQTHAIDLRRIRHRITGSHTYRAWVAFWRRALEEPVVISPSLANVSVGDPAVIDYLIGLGGGEFSILHGGEILLDADERDLAQTLTELYERVVRAEEPPAPPSLRDKSHQALALAGAPDPTDPPTDEANIPEPVEAPAPKVRKHYPSPMKFEKMQGRAKRRRRNFQKYAEKHGPWTLFGDDPTNRKHWEK